ncbi:hypothetical protein ABIE13_000234 [Ottowia thiooxydans]|uniref:Transposase n=1 Tax=Ottowia thiooxydans TaxID=219182 RepID=A0ABV2Q2I2_9BURK
MTVVIGLDKFKPNGLGWVGFGKGWIFVGARRGKTQTELGMAFLICSRTSFALAGIGVPGP